MFVTSAVLTKRLLHMGEDTNVLGDCVLCCPERPLQSFGVKEQLQSNLPVAGGFIIRQRTVLNVKGQRR